MKILMTLILVNLFLISSAQYRIDGYCGKTKLQDIEAKYGEVSFTTKAAVLAGTAMKQFVFDYGQEYKKDKEAIVCNDKGEVITFTSIAQVLNFLDYNGWEFVSTMDSNNSYIILFKKKV